MDIIRYGSIAYRFTARRCKGYDVGGGLRYDRMCALDVTKNGGREGMEMRQRGENFKILGNGDKEMRYVGGGV